MIILAGVIGIIVGFILGLYLGSLYTASRFLE
jgi:hypothetical protein